MFPPPNSYFPPPVNSNAPQGAVPPGGTVPQKTADFNQTMQQMQGMKIDDMSTNKFPGPSPSGHSLPAIDSANYNSSHNLPSSVVAHHSQNMNRTASTTNVTYSPQLRATYPYSPQGSTASNTSPAPHSVPCVKTYSSSGYMPAHNGSSYTSTDSRNGMPNGDFPDSQLIQAHSQTTGPPVPSVPAAKQNSDLNFHSNRPAKSNMSVLHSQPTVPTEQSSYGSCSTTSGQIRYIPPGAPGGSTAYRPSAGLGVATSPGAYGLHSIPGSPIMPTPNNQFGASHKPISQSLPPSAPGVRAPNSASGIPSRPTAFNSHGAPSGPSLNCPPGVPSGSMPYSPPGASTGSLPYSQPGAPSGLVQYNLPGALPHAVSGPVSSSTSSSLSGPTHFGPPGAVSGPLAYSPPGGSSGAAPHSPPSSSSGPVSGGTPYSPHGAPASGPVPYNPSGFPRGPAPYSVPGPPSGQVPYSPLSSPSGPAAFGPQGVSQGQSSFQQQQRKLELDQMPSAVQVREEDKKCRSGYYPTDTKCMPPPHVTTNFIAQDRGVCSPRFMRSTLYCLPNSPDILKQTAVPFAIVVNPMAAVCSEENEPPLCMFREEGPLRCKRCKAYMCSFMTFGEGGRCFQCAFCKVATEVPQDYFCYLDGIGQRTDKFHRPELCLGSYEFIATKDYCKNGEQPNSPAYIFMIEVSKSTLGNGLVHILCENMKNILAALQGDEKKSTAAKVGFVTYNNVLHFYNLKKSLSQPHIMVMPDVHDAFVPLLDGFLVSVSEADTLIDSLMTQIPQMYVNEPSGEVLLGPVVQAGLEALKNANCAGKLLIFHSTLPTCDAPGKLQKRDGQKLLGTEKQKTVLTPQNPLYNKLAEDCVAAGCCVDLFLFPSDYVDVASMSPLCRHTGGHMYKYMYFQSHVDGNRFLEDVERNVTTPTAFDAVLRIRTSAGISPIFHYGNFFMSNSTDIEISALNCHKATTVEFAYDEKLAENDTVFIQAALLYTTVTGDRRIRVHNLSLSTSTTVADMYKGCELDTIVNFLAKQGLKQVFEQTPQQARSSLASRTVKMLSGYRKHCSATSSSSQLILPETLKLLPLYANCLLKSDALTGGPEISLDDRSFAMLALNGMDVRSSVLYFYPVLISLHDLDVNSDEMPIPVRCSMEKLSNNGAYLLSNGIYMFLWISQGISPEWLNDMFGVQSPSAINKQQASLMELDTPLSKRICHIIEDLEEMSMWCMRLNIVVQGDKLEIVFRQFLVEDRGVDGSPSYVEFVCHLHKEITKLL